jgi:small subunit ribosomal protein S7
MRHKKAPKREIAADPKFSSTNLAKFINYMMKGGKKNTAMKVVYDAMDIVAEKTGKNAIDAFEEAIKNVSPAVEVKSRRVGGANYQIPIPVRGERRLSLAFRWMIEAAKAHKGKPMAVKIAEEIASASANEGNAVKKRADVHRMAEANRAFAHFAKF